MSSPPTISKTFNFTGHTGETLSGKLELPAIPKAFALFAHCFTCSKNSLAASRISRQLSTLGIATLRFDFTGIGQSEGEFKQAHFSGNIADLKAAYHAIEQAYSIKPSLLIGHSLGGAAVLKFSTLVDSIKAVATIGAPSDIEHVTHLFSDQIPQESFDQAVTITLGQRQFEIDQAFAKDFSQHQLLSDIKKNNNRCAYLIMHSPTDQIVSIDHAAQLYQGLRHPKSFVSLDQTDHLLNSKQDALYVAQMIATWGQRYLKDDEQKNQKTDPTSESVIVSSRPSANYTQDIYTRHHHLIADEPKKVKGDDLGPGPYQLLMAALGSCTNMTMHMYARRKNFPLEKSTVSLTHSPASEKKETLTKEIRLVGPLTEDQRDRILSIAKKCPVHRTLESSLEIIEQTKTLNEDEQD